MKERVPKMGRRTNAEIAEARAALERESELPIEKEGGSISVPTTRRVFSGAQELFDAGKEKSKDVIMTTSRDSVIDRKMAEYRETGKMTHE